MVIGFNCLIIDPEYVGGVANYTFGLISGFQKIKAHKFILFTNEQNHHIFERFACDNVVLHKVAPYDAQWKRRLMWQPVKLTSQWLYDFLQRILYGSLIKELNAGIDVLYSSTTILYPIHNTATTVLSMHDVQQYHFPQFFSKMQLKDREVTYGLSAKHANYIQASSQFIKDDLLDKFVVLRPEQIAVIPEGVNIALFRQNVEANHSVTTKYNLPQGYIFYPAQMWPHKDHITVLKAILKLKEQGFVVPLVLTGARYTAADEVFGFVDKHGLGNQVYYLGKVPYDDIIALYQNAGFLISASLHESNCLTILEAAAAGVPVIASDIPPNIELLETLKLNLFPQRDDNALAELIRQIFNHDELKQQQVSANKIAIEQFSWDNIAQRYMALFEKIQQAKKP